jgi:hypothetical protein
MGVYFGELHIVGDTLYTFKRMEIFVWSLEDPTNPALMKSMERPYALDGGWEVDGGIILSHQYVHGPLPILDTREPSKATVRDITFGDGQIGFVKAIKDNRLIYFNGTDCKYGGCTYHLQIYDSTDIFQPKLLGTYDQTFQDVSRTNAVIHGSFVDIEPEEGPGFVLDISDPTHPTLTDARPQSISHDITNEDGTLLYRTMGGQLDVYRADGGIPIGSLQLPVDRQPEYESWGIDSNLWYADGTVFAVVYSGPGIAQFSVIDVHDPENPQLAAISDLRPYQILAYKGYFYFHLWGDGIGIYRLVPN